MAKKTTECGSLRSNGWTAPACTGSAESAAAAERYETKRLRPSVAERAERVSAFRSWPSPAGTTRPPPPGGCCHECGSPRCTYDGVSRSGTGEDAIVKNKATPSPDKTHTKHWRIPKAPKPHLGRTIYQPFEPRHSLSFANVGVPKPAHLQFSRHTLR